MIKAERLSRKYGEKQVLDGLELEVRPGETLAVTGESGCGKTTLLRILSGLDGDYEGEVYLKGRKARGLEPNERGTALVLQQPALWNHMTVEENILFPVKRRERRAARSRMEYICQKLEIGELLRRYPGEISGGQAKRVSLARALAAQKEILLLDEPLSNLDGGTKEKVLAFLEEEYAGHVTMVYVSHDEKEVERLACKVMKLSDARKDGR